MARWYRLCIDLSTIGEVRGTSYETHEDDERVGIWVGPHATVDDVREALELLLHEVHRAHAHQLELWPG